MTFITTSVPVRMCQPSLTFAKDPYPMGVQELLVANMILA